MHIIFTLFLLFLFFFFEYRVYSTTTSKGGAIINAWHKDIGVLAALCDADEFCVGFSSLGVLKANITQKVATPGVTLYTKKSSTNAIKPITYSNRINNGLPIIPLPRPTPTAFHF
jgi:hypothetical protein